MGMTERLRRLKPAAVTVPDGGPESLQEVLQQMSIDELCALARGPLRSREPIEGVDHEALQALVDSLISRAAAFSFPRATRPTYPEVVARVARNLRLPSPPGVHVGELERVILFKVMEQSLERMDDQQRRTFVEHVQGQLQDRGVKTRVTFQELLKFAKFGAFDVGGTVGGLVLAGPGLYGLIGLNFLQFVVLKGIVLTSGYMAGGAALLGIGVGGAMLTVAGAALPISAGFAILYTAYAASGPAFRKLVPTVCFIAAKRLALNQSQRGWSKSSEVSA